MDREQFGQWKHHPVTREVMQFLSEKLDYLERYPWMQLLKKDNADLTHSNVSEMAGRCDELRRLIELSYDDLHTEEGEEDAA